MITDGQKPDLLSSMPLPTETPQPPWLMSFADFVSCLLACFVLLYSLVAVDRAKFDKMLEGMPGRQVVEDIPGSADRAMQILPQDEGRNADYLAALMRAKLEQDPALAKITVEGQGDRVLLHLPPKELLSIESSGEAAGQRLVYALGGALGAVPNRLAVEVRPDRPAEFAAGLAYAVRLAQRLEQAGVNGTPAARARLTAPGEAAGIDLIVFDKAPATSTP
ncbi:flagellar motor protein MotB [Dongia sedimenti]|uniref:Flagellar motor protein MotB n=1 Tax=Dongia sedimenti TaxID=3064282 RepID=A0ABU0YHX1_9PROT|nr:flagellar motor protein MotB [Rhodospirillaceae bacterium R-7]